MLCQFWMYELRFCLHKLPGLGGNSSIQKIHHITDMNHPDSLCKNHLDRVEPHKLWRERDETHKLWRIKPLFYPWVLQNKGATIFYKNPFSEKLLEALCPSCILHRKDTMPELLLDWESFWSTDFRIFQIKSNYINHFSPSISSFATIPRSFWRDSLTSQVRKKHHVVFCPI